MKLATVYSNDNIGESSEKIYEVVGDQVTINRNHAPDQYFENRNSTAFNEVNIKNPSKGIPKEILAALSNPRSKNMSADAFFNGVVETLRNEIIRTWNPKKHHLIQHSSGWDSRIMGVIIKNLHDELGDGWLGPITFVAWGHEVDLARKIVFEEGWPPESFVGLPKDEVYFDQALNFEEAWRPMNGSSVYPINNPYWAFHRLREKGVTPKDPSETQVYAASWFNEMFEALVDPKSPPFEQRFLNKFYYCVNGLHGAAMDFEFNQPLYNPETVRHFVQLQGSFYTPGEARSRLVARLSPRLANIPRLDHRTIKIPRRLFERAISDYGASWYGKNIVKSPPGVTDDLRMSHWWAHWSTASLVDHLLHEGVSVS